jgi:hypothetical protein
VVVEAVELPPSMTAEAWVILAAVSESRRKSLREERWGGCTGCEDGTGQPQVCERPAHGSAGADHGWKSKGTLALTSTARPRAGRRCHWQDLACASWPSISHRPGGSMVRCLPGRKRGFRVLPLPLDAPRGLLTERSHD